MTRLLALCTGASVGLAVGWLWGSNTSRLVEAHALAAGAVRRSEPRTPVPGTPGRSDVSAALTEAIPAQRDDEPEMFMPLADGSCAIRSDGGGLRCVVKGRHQSHAFEMYAPDPKVDADERIE